MSNNYKIGIVGLGLIGGSIEKALIKETGFEVLTVSVSQNRPNKLADLADADIVFLCGSQSSILENIKEIAKLAAVQNAFARTLITDVASTKSYINNKAAEFGLNNFIAGHPMAGTEHRGYEASLPELFQGAKWILCPQTEDFVLQDKLNLLTSIITKTLGAQIETMDAVTHDKAVALISHLPLLLSLGLGEIVGSMPSLQRILGPGCKGMLRLAKGNADMGREIITINRQNIRDAWELFKVEVDAILEMKGSNLQEELELVKDKLVNCL